MHTNYSRLGQVLTTVLLLVAAGAAWGQLPPGWTDADLGAPPLAGSSLWSNGTWTISASGADICGNDQLHFAWMPVIGDDVIAAKVTSIQTASGQAGLTFRNDTTTGSLEAAVLATASNGITFQWRSTPGQGCSYQIALGVASINLPVSLQLRRSGISFRAHWRYTYI